MTATNTAANVAAAADGIRTQAAKVNALADALSSVHAGPLAEAVSRLKAEADRIKGEVRYHAADALATLADLAEFLGGDMLPDVEEVPDLLGPPSDDEIEDMARRLGSRLGSPGLNGDGYVHEDDMSAFTGDSADEPQSPADDLAGDPEDPGVQEDAEADAESEPQADAPSERVLAMLESLRADPGLSNRALLRMHGGRNPDVQQARALLEDETR